MLSTYRRLRIAAACAPAAIAAVLASSAWADPAPPLATLLQRLEQSPSSMEASALLDAAEARARQAQIRTNPSIALDVENALGTGAFSGFSNSETTLSIGQDLQLGGRRAARIGAAQGEIAVATTRQEIARTETAANLALTYVEAEAWQQRAILADEALALVIDDARAATRLVEEGREPLLRGIQATTEAAAARANTDQAKAERDAAYARLTVLASLPSPVTSVPEGLLSVPPGSVQSATTPLAVRLAEAERAATERRVAVEVAQSRPDVSASVGVRRFAGDNATALTFGASVPLQVFDRNRGNIEAARADLRAADARLALARQSVQANRAAAAARLASFSSRVSATDAGVRSADEAYRLARIGFEAGRISQLELRATRADLINARSAAIDARVSRAQAEIDLARLQGASFGAAQ